MTPNSLLTTTSSRNKRTADICTGCRLRRSGLDVFAGCLSVHRESDYRRRGQMLSPEITDDACSCPVTAVLVICRLSETKPTETTRISCSTVFTVFTVFAVLVCDCCVGRSQSLVFAVVCCSVEVQGPKHGDGSAPATVALLARGRMCCGYPLRNPHSTNAQIPKHRHRRPNEHLRSSYITCHVRISTAHSTLPPTFAHYGGKP